jgi:hypothetical protein
MWSAKMALHAKQNTNSDPKRKRRHFQTSSLPDRQFSLCSASVHLQCICPSICSESVRPSICSECVCPSICSECVCPSICSECVCPSICSECVCPSTCSAFVSVHLQRVRPSGLRLCACPPVRPLYPSIRSVRPSDHPQCQRIRPSAACPSICSASIHLQSVRLCACPPAHLQRVRPSAARPSI